MLLAAFHGDDGAIDCLMEYEADVDSADAAGSTPLHIAALHGAPPRIPTQALQLSKPRGC